MKSQSTRRSLDEAPAVASTSPEEERVEWRDGKRFVVKVLPEVPPPEKRSTKTRFHYSEVGKPGDVTGAPLSKPKRKRRKR